MGIFMFLVIKVMLPMMMTKMMMTKMMMMMKMVCRYLGRDQRMTPPESPRESVHNNTSQVGNIDFNLKKQGFVCLFDPDLHMDILLESEIWQDCSEDDNFVSQGMDTTSSLDHLEGREQGSSSTKNIFGYSFRHF